MACSFVLWIGGTSLSLPFAYFIASQTYTFSLQGHALWLLFGKSEFQHRCSSTLRRSLVQIDTTWTEASSYLHRCPRSGGLTARQDTQTAWVTAHRMLTSWSRAKCNTMLCSICAIWNLWTAYLWNFYWIFSDHVRPSVIEIIETKI